jgi:thioredoxin reductase
MYDVIVVGGSYAGLSAATQLARARRNMLVIDGGKRRNRFADVSHGFLGRDGADPAAIVAEARTQLLAYPTVGWRDESVTAAEIIDGGFALTGNDGERHETRRLVLALGVADELPALPGLAERWGRTVFHCPYCHGYEIAGDIGVLAVSPASLHHALMLPDWGPTTYFLNGGPAPAAEDLVKLEARGVTLVPEPIRAISGAADVVFESGRVLSMGGIFTATRTRPSSPIAETLGCELDEGAAGPYIRTDMMKQTTVPGIFACGDAARAFGSVALAVGDGAQAGAAAHQSLIFR